MLDFLILGLPRCHQPENVEHRTYNISSLIIGQYGVLSYPVSVIYYVIVAQIIPLIESILTSPIMLFKIEN